MIYISGNFYGWNMNNDASSSVHTPVSGELYLSPFELHSTVRFDRLRCSVDTTEAGPLVTMAVYNSLPSGMPAGLMFQDPGTNTTTSAGTKSTIIDMELFTGLYWLGVATTSTTATLDAYVSNYNVLGSASLTGAGTTHLMYDPTWVSGAALPADLAVLSSTDATGQFPIVSLRVE